MRAIGELGTIGLSFVLAIAIGFGGGVMLDRWLGTRWIWLRRIPAGIRGGDRERLSDREEVHQVGDDERRERRCCSGCRSTAAVCCAAMAVVALLRGPRRSRPAIGVLGGGMLAGVSLLGIRSSVGGLLTARRVRRPVRACAVDALKVVGRYALLALLAYVMIARLRLHPLGLLAGASSVVAAAAIEAGRLLSKKQ